MVEIVLASVKYCFLVRTRSTRNKIGWAIRKEQHINNHIRFLSESVTIEECINEVEQMKMTSE